MTAARRWCCVAVGVLLLVLAPMLVRALPARDQQVSADELRQMVREARAHSFSGYVETDGHLGLPENDAVSGLTKLLGETNRVRVWWSDPARWRTATLRPTGETDLVHSGDHLVRWVYESKRATMMPDVPVRLPHTGDLLPPELARHVLAGARPAELRRLPARRVAGRDALGLRLTPADRQAAIGRVDVYADPATGVPLRVDLFASGSSRPVLTSRFLDFSADPPAAAALRFRPPRDARLRYDTVVDLASASDRFASRIPPRRLAGLAPRGGGHGSVGVYGRGPTVLLAVPLWSRTAERVCEELRGRPGVRALDEGLLLGAPPVRLLLARPEVNGTRWLLAGTVTRRALRDAAGQLAARRPALGGQR